jgi:hypothetical protein
MAAWGQTMAHWLHWMQLSMTHSGTMNGHAAFFVLGGGHRENAVRRKGADRQLVALLGQTMGCMTFLMKSGSASLCVAAPSASAQEVGVLDLDQLIEGLIDGGEVHVDDVFALLPNSS